MVARSGNTLGTLLLSVPIAAVLLMAVFRIPRFAPGVNGDSQTVWEDPREFFRGMRGEQEGRDEFFDEYERPGSSSGRNPFSQPGDDHARVDSTRDDAPGWGSNDNGSRNPQQPGPTRGLGTGYEPNGDSHSGQPMPFPGTSPRVTPSPPYQPGPGGSAAPVQITWKQGAERLRELGINEYHLEPGQNAGEFLFVCLYHPGHDTNISHRFESTHTDPLAAVADVIRQVEGYFNNRHAEGTSSLFPYGGR